MDTFEFFEDECDQPTKSGPIPIFRDERNLPKRVAGLDLSGVQHYPDPADGVGVTFKGPDTLATAYLYNLGLAEVPTPGGHPNSPTCDHLKIPHLMCS
jgi:hypothetical protein